eukprot:COSAG02_NODE_5381_length_4381_cov_1.963568_5_plen_53_part_00
MYVCMDGWMDGWMEREREREREREELTAHRIASPRIATDTIRQGISRHPQQC